ncbi:MAG: site-specific integrase [Pseudomonadota bacterium]
MPTIRKCKSKRTGKVTWQAVVRLSGVKPQSATFDSKRDASRWAYRREEQIRRGHYAAASDAERWTVSQAAERYFSEALPKLRSAAARRKHIGWLVERVGALPLARLTPARLAELRDELARTEGVRSGRKPSAASVNRHLAAWSALLAKCHRDWHLLETNPASQVRKEKEPPGRDRYLSEDERARFLEACRRSKNPMLYPAVLIALCTGGRQAEVLGLRWRDVDLKEGTAQLRRGATKNEEPRTLVLRGQALDALKSWHGSSRFIAPDDYVFPSRNGLKPTDGLQRKPFQAALEEAEIDDFRWHDLRHCTGSYLAMSGATELEIAKILGHKTTAMVKRYSHLSTDHSRSVIDRMTEKFKL